MFHTPRGPNPAKSPCKKTARLWHCLLSHWIQLRAAQCNAVRCGAYVKQRANETCGDAKCKTRDARHETRATRWKVAPCCDARCARGMHIPAACPAPCKQTRKMQTRAKSRSPRHTSGRAACRHVRSSEAHAMQAVLRRVDARKLQTRAMQATTCKQTRGMHRSKGAKKARGRVLPAANLIRLFYRRVAWKRVRGVVE